MATNERSCFSMKRKGLSILLTFALVFFMFGSTVNADNVKKPLPDFTKASTVEKKSVSTTGENEKSIELKLEGPVKSMAWETQKIYPDLQKHLDSLKPDETIKVDVCLDYNSDVTVDTFVNKIVSQEKGTFGNTKIEKRTAFHFLTDVNKQQIDALSKMKEVKYIKLPAVKQQISTPKKTNGLLSDGGIIPMINASTEMTGAKKARQDYGVTGNRDGNETSYSSNDVVVAIIDTGIDNTHVDLDGGKVIGWRDFVNNNATPYDDNGHGTMVSSIVAGTGEGDPGIEVGFAPGAALVGIKVADSTGGWTIDDLVDGIDWAVANRTTLGIRVINISLGAYGNSSSEIDAVNTAITNANNVGIAVVVAAGNDGPEYDNMSQLVSCDDPIVVGSMADPYEGGWYPSLFSSRGTGTTGPLIMAPGENIRAAEANSTNEYVTESGTSFSTPAISGIIALMMDASNGSSTLNFYIEDFGKSGFDPVCGNGEVLAYDSIKAAGGYSSGSFNDYRDHIRASDTMQQGDIHAYDINVYATSSNLYWATTLIMTDEDSDDFDLYIWNPGSDPSVDPPDYSSTSVDPQEVISFKPTTTGVYTVAVHAFSGNGNYALDFSGQIRP